VEIEEIESGKIYDHAFEWRFEFPEILDDEGKFVGFDIVIGNPPYGVKLTKNEDFIFREKYQVSNYQIDTYTLFTELGIKISQSKFSLCFIIPNAWYASIYDIKYRRYLIENKIISSITVCPNNTFDDAVVETCIIECIQEDVSDALIIYSLQRKKINEIVFNKFRLNERYSINLFSQSIDLALISKVVNSSEQVNSSFEVIWGIKIYEKGKGTPPQNGEESKYKNFHSTSKLSATHKPLIGGREIYPYRLSWKGGFVNYGPWIAAPRQPIWFEANPRIVVREVTSKGKIFATLILDEYVFSNSVDGIKSKENNINNLKVLLAILNSKFAQFFHLKKSGNSQKNSFPKVLLQDLREFPFPKHRNNFETVAKLVDQILTVKKSNPNGDITTLEQQIDQLVYELYGLTEEEIKIVEGKT